MNKYIIEIEDVPFSKVRIDADGAQNINLYRAKGFNALVFDKHGLDKLTPIDKALNEHYQRGLEEGKKQAKVQAHLDVCHDIDRVAHGNYQKGLDDAWETAKKIFALDDFEAEKCGLDDVDGMTASEAIAKLREYEQQKTNAEIMAGDEVKNTLELMNNAVGYFIEPTNYRVLRYIDGKIDIVAWHRENCVRTGGHSYAVERMVGVMKGEQSCSSCEIPME